MIDATPSEQETVLSRTRINDADRFEIKDSQNPSWRGMRFSSFDRALRELLAAVPADRFYILDRSSGITYDAHQAI